MDPDICKFLEQMIDEMTAELPEMKGFVSPGSSVLSAQCHIARTVCRRAERRLIALPGVDDAHMAFINRLSDFLFVLSRYVLKMENIEETLI